MLTRRQFALTATVPFASGLLRANPLGLPLGCQTFPMRDQLGKDFEGTLRQLASIGFQSIEMCSPPGYVKYNYGSLLNVKAADLKKTINTAGLVCESCHFQFREFTDTLDERIAWSKELGLKQMVCSTFSLPRDAGMADWLKAADGLNRAAEKVARAGMKTGYHNHAFEFHEIDGVLPYDKIMAQFDPKLVGMQFQTEVFRLGYDPAAYLEKYPGRILSMHLQDISAEKKMVAVGKGNIDWAKTFQAAKKAGVRNYFVEMDFEVMKESVPYLRSLKA